MLNENTVRSLEVPQQYIDNVIAKEQKVAMDRQKHWGTDPKEWKDCDVVLIVDDGIATGKSIFKIRTLFKYSHLYFKLRFILRNDGKGGY